MSMMKKSELSLQVLTKLDRLLDRHVDALSGEADFTRHQAYRWDGQKKGLKPIKRAARIDHDDLIGIDAVKQEVNQNTKNFLAGVRANNVLLWGERGTGKSSLIKSLFTTFEGTNLRMVQVFKHDLLTVLEMYDLISDNPACRFIFFVEVLSFEEGQTDYQELKTVIDGARGSSGQPPLLRDVEPQAPGSHKILGQRKRRGPALGYSGGKGLSCRTVRAPVRVLSRFPGHLSCDRRFLCEEVRPPHEEGTTRPTCAPGRRQERPDCGAVRAGRAR